MATQAPPEPEVVCKLFLSQYYQILHESPDQVHKFYQDGSRIGWTGSDGVTEIVTTLSGINAKIMSMDLNKYSTKIDTADAVSSHNDSVLIVVTGSFSSDNDVCLRFTQTFFLAPQENGGYFVLNDILRIFLSEKNQDLSVADTTPAAVEEPLTTDPMVVGNDVACGEPLNPAVNSTTVDNNPIVNSTTVENNVAVESPVKVTKEDVKKTPVAASPPPAQKDIPKKHPVSASAPPPAPKHVIKKTYASIVKDNKEVSLAPVKPKIAKPVSKPPTKVVEESAKPLQATETAPASTSATKSNTSRDEEGYSIFVAGLPSHSTAKMVGEEFQKFGAIKAGGIQVRNSKVDRSCFGFVEFESQQSMQAAIEASPIFISENEIIIEKKLTRTRVVNGVVTNAGGGAGFQYARGAENFRGQRGGYVNHANYHGADNFNRREGGGEYFNRSRDDGFRHQNEFSGRGRGTPQGFGYHQNGNGFRQSRPFQNENGRYARINSSPKEAPVAAGVNRGPKEAPVAAGVNRGPKEAPVAAGVNSGPKEAPVAAGVNSGPKETPVAAGVNSGPKETPVAAGVNSGPKETPVAAGVNKAPKETPVAAAGVKNGQKQAPVAA